MDTQMHHGNMHQAHVDEPGKQSEHAAIHSLITPHNATHTAVKNGSWFDVSTWKGGKIPGANAKVVIPKGITVDYDNVSNTRLFGLRVDGQIDFATDVDTQMIIDTFVVSSDGTLTIGTEDNPVQGNVETKILIADNGAINKHWDPQQLSRGIVSHGTVSIHGQAKTSHLRVAVDPSAGDKTLTLGEVPVNWQVGDRLILTGTQYVTNGTQDEERTITRIDGKRITLDKALSYSHDTPRDDLKAYVANQSRNVVVATENASKLPSNQRGHVMFMHSDNVDVRYAEFNELGRTDKSKLLDDFKLTGGHAPKRILDGQGNPITGARTNIRGRYALHLHRTGVNGTDAPAVLVGNSVVGSPGWGIVQHDSYAVLENNLAYDVFGAGIVSETGNEIGSWRNNISIKNEGRSQNEKGGAYNHDLGFGGHGFWFQSRLIESEGNVAAGNGGSGMFYFHRGTDEIQPLTNNLAIQAWAKGQDTIKTSDSPIMGFKNNEVFGSRNGLSVIKNSQVQKHDGRTLLDGFKAWEVTQGTELQYTAHYTLKDFDLLGTDTGLHRRVLNNGVHLFHNVEDFVFDNLKVEGFGKGVTLNKETRVVKPLKNWGYFFVDAQVKNNKQDWVNVDRNVDKFLSSNDLQPGKLSFQIDNAKSDLVASSGDNRVLDAVSIVGTKTDSLGTIALPFGNENLGYPLHQLRNIAADQGYYTLPNGQHGVVIDEYISDRLTGDTRKYSFVAVLENKNWTRNARYLGSLNPSELKQDSKIIPFESITLNYPEFAEDTIQVELPPVSPPVVVPPLPDVPPVTEPDVAPTPPVTEPDVAPITPPVAEPPVAEPPVVEPPVVESPPVAEPPVVEPPVVEPPVVTPPVFNPSPLPTSGKYRVEAEDLALDGYRIVGQNKDWLSQKKYIAIDDQNGSKGSASGTFDGEAGTYRVKAVYFDENDGVSDVNVTVAGNRRNFKLNRQLSGGDVSNKTLAGKTTHGSIELKAGDTFEIESTRNGGEQAAFDYIEFIRTGPPSQSPTVPDVVPAPPAETPVTPPPAVEEPPTPTPIEPESPVEPPSGESPVTPPPLPDAPLPELPSDESPVGESPVGNTMIRVETELYNINDFKDINAANRGGAGDALRRDLAVDVASGPGDSLNVGWISRGEYLTYTIEVPDSGEYRLNANIASNIQANHGLKVSVDGQSSIANFSRTGGWQDWQLADGDGLLNLTAGTHTLRVDMLSTGFNLDYLELEQVGGVTPPVVETPVVSPVELPVDGDSMIRVEAELYNINDFKDINAANRGGAGDALRRDLAVDVANSSTGSLNVGWINKGEYLTYDIEVLEAGDYSLNASIASKMKVDHGFRVSVNGQSTTANFGETGGWQTWQAVSGDDVLSLAAGTHTLRVDMLSTGFNLDYLELQQMGNANTAAAGVQGNGEVDILIGKQGADTFVLGNVNRPFYDDGDMSQPGLQDYALIKGFVAAEGDKIQLHGSVDEYLLGTTPTGTPSGTAIFHNQDEVSELIAVVENASPSGLAGAFTFVA